MNLTLLRFAQQPGWTLGALFIGDRFECFTVEDEVRAEKIAGSTAIPVGRYRIKVTWSPKFRRDLPLLLDVPGFDGIRIHAGNTAADTEGCILPGLSAAAARVNDSRLAFEALFEKITFAIRNAEDVWIDVRGY